MVPSFIGNGANNQHSNNYYNIIWLKVSNQTFEWCIGMILGANSQKQSYGVWGIWNVETNTRSNLDLIKNLSEK